jgi:hypothetical protein
MASVRCRPDIASQPNADNISFGRDHRQSGKTGLAVTPRLKSLAYTPDVDEYIDGG